MLGPAGGGARPLETLNLPPPLLARLLGAGFQRVGDFAGLSPTELMNEAGVTQQEAVMTWSMVNNKTAAAQETALDVHRREESLPSISTFVPALDQMLGGNGVPMCKVTEFCGAPGLGKTQLAIQLAVNVQLPTALGGPGGHCIYIDTEGSFMATRVAEIAQGIVERLAVPLRGLDEAAREAVSVEGLLSNIYYFRVHNFVEQIALMACLRDRIRNELTKVKLIIVDSIAFHFRRHFEDFSVRTRLLGTMAQTLIGLAKEFGLAVVLMNQVTTKLERGKRAELVPALGETWGHSATNRIMLLEHRGVRWARLVKSPNMAKAEACYIVTEQGLAGADAPPERPAVNDEEEEEGDEAIAVPPNQMDRSE
jgi:RAD51-like protein 2